MNILLLGPRSQKMLKNLRLESLGKFLKKKNNNIFYSDKKINLNYLKKNSINFIISNGYKFKISKNICKIYKHKCINLHNALLPHSRGVGVNLFCLIKGLKTGVTIHEIDEKFDEGNIILKKEISFNKNETYRTFYLRLLEETNLLFIKNWDKIKKNKIKTIKQNKKNIDFTTRSRTETLLEYFDNSYDIPIKKILKFKETFLNNEKFFEGYNNLIKLKTFNYKYTKNLLNIFNSARIRNFFYKRNKIKIDEHIKFLRNNFDTHKSKIYLAFLKYSNQPFGFIRYDTIEKNHFEISLAVQPKYYGKGLGTKMMGASLRKIKKLGQNKITAVVKKNNERSWKSFIKNDFRILENSKAIKTKTKNRVNHNKEYVLIYN